jgi:hypothetical protein
VALRVAKFLLIPNRISSRITLGYSSGLKTDGLGAQLQRILGINALGEYWNINVQHPRIDEVAIHPLDGIDHDQDYKEFLRNLNSLIKSKEALEDFEFTKILSVDELRLSSILVSIYSIVVLRKTIYLKVTHPYFFIDAMPRLYDCSLNRSFKQRLALNAKVHRNSGISLHHRHGVGLMAIQPGQNKPRELDVKVYFLVLDKIIKSNPELEVRIFTDAPKTSLNFTPKLEQKKSWLNLPSFDGDVMRISSNSFNTLLERLPPDTKVIRGGDPLKTIANMAASSILILSRSSFGYVAALLSEGAEVWIPDDFWHPALPGWKSYSTGI